MDELRQEDDVSGRIAPAVVAPSMFVERAISVLTAIGGLLALIALADLAVRAMLRLELRWDTFWYHVPFAALRGGLGIPYDLSDTVRHHYEGFPPLPDLLQGLLWRLTGSINATGVVNYLAFLAFLTYGHVVLKARLWLVALIALTAPMVLIHVTVSYVDLFANSLLAIGMSSCLSLYLFPERLPRVVMLGGLCGLVGAAWSKFTIVPIVVLGFCLFLVLCIQRTRQGRGSRQVGPVVLAAVLAALPYGKNLAVYGNPFWPFRVPAMETWFPYKEDGWERFGPQRPQVLMESSQAGLFVHSMLEINHPTRYDDRPRWIIDQGNASLAFRMGGFWGVGVVVYLATMMILLVIHDRKTGSVVGLVTAGVLGVVAVLPQSHELRYYQFIPLCWAAAIGMLFPHFRKAIPFGALALLLLVIGLFSYMVHENLAHYRVSKMDYVGAAQWWRAAPWWDRLERGQTYCAVGMVPIGILLTGPTMSEYSIVDRSSEALCPEGTMLVTPSGLQHVVHHTGTE